MSSPGLVASQPTTNSRSPRSGFARRHLLHLPLLLLVLTALFPLGLLFINTFKSDSAIKANAFTLPDYLHWENFANAWNEANYGPAFRNSIIVTSITVALVCLLGGMCAYGLARFAVPGINVVLVYLFITFSLPGLLYLVPLFILWHALGLVDTLQGIILIYTAQYIPFAIMLLRSYFLGLPRELEDAARVDGCTEFGVFRRVIMPLSWPGFASVGLIVGIWSWNEFIFAITFLPSQGMQTVAVRYTAFSGQYTQDLAASTAAATIMILPAMILFLLLQKRFVAGMTAGGVRA
jgi:raffinose/stachyose/melibiose transport system permease protein